MDNSSLLRADNVADIAARIAYLEAEVQYLRNALQGLEQQRQQQLSIALAALQDVYMSTAGANVQEAQQFIAQLAQLFNVPAPRG